MKLTPHIILMGNYNKACSYLFQVSEKQEEVIFCYFSFAIFQVTFLSPPLPSCCLPYKGEKMQGSAHHLLGL